MMSDQVDGAGKARRPAASHLFLVRLWEEPGDGTLAGEAAGVNGALARENGFSDREWKGKVQHVVSGESHNFEDLPSLVEYLRAMMLSSTSNAPAGGPATTE